MGPRPPRRGAAAIAGTGGPPRQVAAASRPIAPVGAPSPRHRQAVETLPLPADTRRALSGIVKQLRDVPRAIIGDPAEVVHFLGRTARALERLRDEPVPVTTAPAVTSPQTSAPLSVPTSPPRALSPRERAEAVFKAPGATSDVVGKIDTRPLAALSAPRTVTDRKGRGVRVEVRRARQARQLEMLV